MNNPIASVPVFDFKAVHLPEFNRSEMTTPEDMTFRKEELAQKALSLSFDPDSMLKAYSLLDLTSLDNSDVRGDAQWSERIKKFCEKALTAPVTTGVTVGGLCVFPWHVSNVARELKGSGIQVVSVAADFPKSEKPLSFKLDEVKQAVQDGADEIDIVLNRRDFLSGDLQSAADEIARIKEVCTGNTLLKVILETCELGGPDGVRVASELAISAGADFIKTSTGKSPNDYSVGKKPEDKELKKSEFITAGQKSEDVLIMLDAIRHYEETSGTKIGIKPAGGIRSVGDAMLMLAAFEIEHGNRPVTRQYFRIGASTLAGEILNRWSVMTGKKEIPADFFKV